MEVFLDLVEVTAHALTALGLVVISSVVWFSAAKLNTLGSPVTLVRGLSVSLGLAATERCIAAVDVFVGGHAITLIPALCVSAISLLAAAIVARELPTALVNAITALEAQSASERYLRSFMENPMPEIHVAPDGVVLDANPAMLELLGYESLKGVELGPLLHPRDRAITAETLALGFTDPDELLARLPFRNRYLRGDGGWQGLEWTLNKASFHQESVAVGFATAVPLSEFDA